MQGQGPGAPPWSIVVYWVLRLWGFPGGTGQGQPPPVFCLGPPCMSYKAIYRWLLPVMGLEIPRQSQPVNLGWLLLVPCLEPLSKWYSGWSWGSLRPDVACLIEFRKL